MTQITSTVDFDQDGKQVGWLRVPHSVTRSAYGVLPIPVAVLRNGDGAKLMLSAGNHGDEYEGQVVLTRLIQQLEASDIRGTLIILPALNLPAVLAATRVSPLDTGNLNRVFPGDPNGGPTWKIADYIEHTLMPKVDVVADFHGGGASLDYRPHASTHYSPDASDEHKKKSLEIVTKLGVPHVMVFERRNKTEGFPDAAIRQGVISIGGEYGGTGSVFRPGVQLVQTAVERLLAVLGIKGELPANLPEPQLLHIPVPKSHVYAPEPGVFEPATELGDAVREGDLCGHVLFPENPTREPVPVTFSTYGDVVCKRHPGRVEAGDCVAHLAAPWPQGG
ncbi:MAG: hypothetical protein HOM68_20145 [Gemmatimonadetes bacterium]|jgi:uncharacterized protein|nr:hypothetical protein [Gemmatimonadota bacterium]MBT4609761.1 hypothetical protein [Gemmatimonadota bacterium]MBT5058865.1 hypothetical protein [Gemmatimonadota bacterium]MBT5146360.1 hypothetical protein [Gemmatimonadota bacterium]MBT5591284.1 hypothetical protein [Gemmatimonadota bacterium]